MKVPVSEERIKQILDDLKDQVIFSITRINYVLQIIELKKQKNHLLLRLEGFYAMAYRDYMIAAFTSGRRLHEKSLRTYNLYTLASTIEQLETSEEKKKQLGLVARKLRIIADSQVSKDITIVASSSIVHKSIKPPRREVLVKFIDMREHLRDIGDLLNTISGILWDASTVLALLGSEDDDFTKEMNHIELTEDIGEWMLRLEPENEIVKQRREFIEKMKNE